ncbi:MAG: Stf0 family sulfotransferase [Gammaproteobacteria bacterium]|nr:Stf0 family sulfotransferase [Gammaproteobacteria bacterium]MDP2139738.1 Stf0 family sulfotransferase [Gammaproteobacteria bacterium]MDP2348941.1 Stf0 family sulfotransferase [Gammaproteobacteria bacterium]
MAIRISDKNRREMSAERDFPATVPVKSRYCILSSPRSGSTLLGRMLYETGLAGDPQEYFNPPLLEIERQTTGNSELDINAFMRNMERRRTSPNGVFGMKLHYSQMLGVFRERQPNKNMLQLLAQFSKLIWIRRRDRLSQAISQAVALHTQVWSSEDSGHGKSKNINVHPFECVRALNMVAGDDFGWERLIAAAGLQVHTVWYEDLVADYEKQCRGVLRFLDLEQSVSNIPAPPLERQAGEINKQLRAELLNYLGSDEEQE